MSIWYQNHPSKELQAGTFFHILWLFSNFFTNNSCFLPSFCYNLCYNVNRRVMVKYHDSVYARKSWSAVAFGPVFASLTRRRLPPVPEGGTSRTYGLRSIKKELWKPSFSYIIFRDNGGSCRLSERPDQGRESRLWRLYHRKRRSSEKTTKWSGTGNRDRMRGSRQKIPPYISWAPTPLPRPARSSTSTGPETVFPRAYLDRNEYTM